MSRVINTNGPGPRRNQALRTIAEALRHLREKPALDAEARDLAAAIALALNDVAETIEESAAAWDDRNYYLKADKFRRDWLWAGISARELTTLIRAGRWEDLPPVLAMLVPHVAGITVTKLTRSAEAWRGAYATLLALPS